MTELSDTFKQNLLSEISEQVSEPQQITAREAVKECLKEIRQGRKKKVPWDAIAEVVRKSVESTYGVSISLAGYTARRYYYELINRGKKDKNSKPRSPSTSTTSRKSSASAPAKTSPNVVQHTAPTTTAEPAPAPEPVARSSAVVEPEVDTVNAPAATPPVQEAQPATSTEELHPNRFRDRFKKETNPKVTRGYEYKTLSNS
jgi:hypothetical protein